MADSDIVVIVEGFSQKDVQITRYSLSTKAADAMATGGQILVYGSMDCGVIEYMASTECSVVCDKKDDLQVSIEHLLSDVEMQKRLYEQSEKMSVEHHDKDRNLTLSEKMFNMLIEDGD